ncbi:YciI family protein [Puia sp.]|uniref:YciI family protein n=1 Tax=Puia sp. TaxID=2045100 RepID=UPI002F42914A
MEKLYFFLRLNPVRADFIQTMTDEERGIMMRHAIYWREFQLKGKLVVYGPVMDAAGPFGMGVAGVDNVEELKEFMARDPALALSTIDYFPMKAVLPDSTFP